MDFFLPANLIIKSMAEISSFKQPEKANRHKSVRVNLTPMVDLGFLLITFFILANAIRQLTELHLTLPRDSPVKTPVKRATVLTFILQGNDSIGYYDGYSSQVKTASFASMRNIIMRKKTGLANQHINKNDLTVIITPTDRSTYKNFIDAIDELSITDCRHYYIANPGGDLMTSR